MVKNIKFIGLSGTNGSGKDAAGKMLAEKHDYLFIDVADLLRNEARRRAIVVERKNLRAISAEWRRELGLGVLVDKAIAQYEKDSDKYVGVVIASLRNPGEAERIHEFGGTVVWLDADQKVRYDRIQKGLAVRNRAGEDNKTFEEFQNEEYAEMHPSVGSDSASLNMLGVKDKSDVIISNDLNDLDVFSTLVEKALGLK